MNNDQQHGDGGRPHERALLAVALAGVAGFIDAVGYLSLDLFTAHMSGNSTRLGVHVGSGMVLRAVPAMFAIGVFVVAITAGTTAMEVGRRQRMRSPAAVLVAVEALLLLVLAAYGGAEAVHGHISRSSTATYYGMAATAVVAMGLQTSTLQRISGQTVRTTYVSGMLTQLCDELAGYLTGRLAHEGEASYLRGELGVTAGPRSGWRVALIASIWLLYAAGAVLGSYLQHRWQLRCLAVPVAALLAIAAVELRWPVTRRTDDASAAAFFTDGR